MINQQQPNFVPYFSPRLIQMPARLYKNKYIHISMSEPKYVIINLKINNFKDNFPQ